MSYTIRQVATQFHMQPSTLRYYEDQGLLTNVERTETGQRIYEDCHIDRLRAICCFKNAGMTIDDLKSSSCMSPMSPSISTKSLICWNLAANPWTSSAEPSTRRPCTCSASFITMVTSSVPSTPVKTGRIGASTKTAPIPLNVEAIEC